MALYRYFFATSRGGTSGGAMTESTAVDCGMHRFSLAEMTPPLRIGLRKLGTTRSTTGKKVTVNRHYITLHYTSYLVYASYKKNCPLAYYRVQY